MKYIPVFFILSESPSWVKSDKTYTAGLVSYTSHLVVLYLGAV